MKRTIKKQKLTLNHETIRQLDDRKLTTVAGGQATTGGSYYCSDLCR